MQCLAGAAAVVRNAGGDGAAAPQRTRGRRLIAARHSVTTARGDSHHGRRPGGSKPPPSGEGLSWPENRPVRHAQRIATTKALARGSSHPWCRRGLSFYWMSRGIGGRPAPLPALVGPQSLISGSILATPTESSLIPHVRPHRTSVQTFGSNTETRGDHSMEQGQLRRLGGRRAANAR